MYTSLNNIIKRLPEAQVIELTQDDSDETDVDTVVLDQAIGDAQSVIDSKLRGRYTVPLISVPNIIEQIATLLVIQNLYGRRPGLQISDNLANQIKTAKKNLDELQTGDQVLEGFEGSASHPSFIAVNKTKEDRLFPQSRFAAFR